MKSKTTSQLRKINLIPLFVWILFLSGINSTAQTIYSVLDESWTNNNWQKEAQTLNTYDGNNYLINSLTQSWVSPPGIWENSFQFNYTNNADGTVNESIAQFWDSGSSTWSNFQRLTYTYNAAKKVLTNTSQIWVGGAWLNSSKITNEYDESGYLIRTLNQNWDIPTDSWKDASQVNFSNNANGTVDYSTTQNWDVSNGWIDNRRTFYLYNNENEVTIAVTETWTGTNWLKDTKETNTYDGSGYLTYSTLEVWNIGSSSWIYDSMEIYYNDSSGNPTQIVYQNWDINTSTWLNTDRLTFDYTLGISEFMQEKSFVLYPNPSTGVITVKLNDSFNSAYSITDQTGRIVKKDQLNSEITSLNISTLAKGVYFFRIDNKYKSSLKFIKN